VRVRELLPRSDRPPLHPDARQGAEVVEVQGVQKVELDERLDRVAFTEQEKQALPARPVRLHGPPAVEDRRKAKRFEVNRRRQRGLLTHFGEVAVCKAISASTSRPAKLRAGRVRRTKVETENAFATPARSDILF